MLRDCGLESQFYISRFATGSMPKLDQRLQTVAQQIRSVTHADIGSDHGHLLAALLHSGRIQRGIAVENKQQPLANSRQSLAGLNADVRFGDGLEPISEGEADSLSICGMGGESIAMILSADPKRVPPRLVLQPNRRADLVRCWAFENQYHLRSEQVTSGQRPFEVLVFEAGNESSDPAYQAVDLEAAIMFGPLNIKHRSQAFLSRLQQERQYLEGFAQLSPNSKTRLELVRSLLDTVESTDRLRERGPY